MSTKLALAMIVRGTAAEAVALDSALASVVDHVDGIFITLTYKPGEPIDEYAREVCAKYGAVVSDFAWVNDFSRARNYNFAQVPKGFTHILWMDADDVIRGAEKIKPTLEENKHVDGFGMWYLYDWDEFKLPTVVHKKTMIVKNDGTAEWVGAIHEDINPSRQYDVKMLEGVDRLHITTKERTADSATRNYDIAQAQVITHKDDPRSYWNAGNAAFALGKFDEAKSFFRDFIKTSGSDEEKYLAYMRLADTYNALNNRFEAIEQMQRAIGLIPDLPDAYLHLGYLHFTFGNMDKAESYTLQGVLKPPRVHRMIVYNPRDYDYNPMMLLANIYHRMNRPDLMLPMLEGCLNIYPNDERLKRLVAEAREDKATLGKALEVIERIQKEKDVSKIKEEIEKLPINLQAHPIISSLRNKHFVKTTSTGKDIVIYCGATTHEWSAETFKTKGIGGSEEAVVHLAKQYKDHGWNVTVYNNCGHQAIVVDGVTYKPFWMWNMRDKQDVVILWRWVRPLDHEINAGKIFVDLHDVVPAGEFTEARLERVTKVCVKSNAHRALFPNIPDSKIAIIPNGLDIATIKNCGEKKNPFLIINTSSPDRSLNVLPEIFKRIKAKEPRARMQWAYGWEIFDNAHGGDQKKMEWAEKVRAEMAAAGIENLGRLPQHEVAKLYKRAGVFLYPSAFYEIDCISLKKAQAGGATPITTDFAAIGENNRTGVKIPCGVTTQDWNKPYQFYFGIEDEAQIEQFVDATIKTMHNPPGESPDWTSDYTWDKTARRWEVLFCIDAK